MYTFNACIFEAFFTNALQNTIKIVGLFGDLFSTKTKTKTINKENLTNNCLNS